MSFNDCKISESQIQTTGVQSQPDTLTGSAADNKIVFDALPTLAIQKLNSLIDQMQQQAAAGQVGVTPFDGMTAQTLQEALEQIYEDIGGNYSGADGAGKVGYTPSEGVDEDTVQEAIEAVQANLTAYIAKIKAATGAAEVGNKPIAGMTATNVQQALEELRENIDNIVSGIIPGGSITSDMLQDGAVTADKLGSDVTGDTIPTSASDPASISSQLSNLESSKAPSGYGLGANCTQITDWNTAIANGWYKNTTYDPDSHSPDALAWYGLTINYSDDTLVQIAFHADNVNSCRAAFRWRHAGAWSNWEPIITATPPQEFDLLLASGFSNGSGGNSIYWKDQFNQVHFLVSVTNQNSLSSGDVIATLPAGFRPSKTAIFVLGSLVSAVRKTGSLNVKSDGSIVYFGDPLSSGAVSFGAGAFVAAD